MERETLLTILLLLFGGLAAQPLALLPRKLLPDGLPFVVERRAWWRLWLPVVPTLVVAASLCGWALREPDPVRANFDHGMLIAACVPFAVIALRAALRAVWVLVREPSHLPIGTVGLLRPRILFSPFLAHAMDEGQIRAAWAHEQAHARHRDPLRIWLAQIATDLQWPWPWAHDRLIAWLEVLEWARDDEARSRGACGVDLAAAIVATARRGSPSARRRWSRSVEPALLGEPAALQARVARLLAPLPDSPRGRRAPGLSDPALLGIACVTLAIAVALGAAYGNSIVHPFLVWTWAA